MGNRAGTDFGFDRNLGTEQIVLGPDRVELRLTVSESHQQPYGLVHGGVWCSLVETATSIGADLWWGERGHIVGVSNHTDFIRAVREGTVTVVATPLHRGNLQQLWVAEIRDEARRLVARGEVRIQNLESTDRLGR